MAVLDSVNRLQVWAHTMRSAVFGSAAGLLKSDLRAVVDALDDWIEANQAAINTAIPQPARTALTLQQKTMLFCFVAMRRAGLLPVEGD